MKAQTMIAILIVVSATILGVAGYQWPFVFAIFMQFPQFLLILLFAIAGTAKIGFLPSSAAAGILFALSLYLFGVTGSELLLPALASFFVPLAFVELLIGSTRYLSRLIGNLRNAQQ